MGNLMMLTKDKYKRTSRSKLVAAFLVGMVIIPMSAGAQVHYHESGRPWTLRAKAGPDAEVPGWFYNLGITGIRVQLVPDEPKTLLVKYVFPKSPASRKVKVGDVIIGANRMFVNEHRNGYGMDVFGADGPILEFAQALEEAQTRKHNGKLVLGIRRDGKTKKVNLNVGVKYGTFAKTFPSNCGKSKRMLNEMLDYLVDHQKKDGSFGNAVHNTFAPLALMASGERKYRPAIERCIQYLCATNSKHKNGSYGLVNWGYTGAAIVLSEYYLATNDKSVIPELNELYTQLAKGQYLKMSQIDPKAKKTHPNTYPKGPKDSYGGWGHNPGFRGYGPICMLTAQGALAYSLMERCGINVDRKSHDAAYSFLRKATGKNGYVWYKDKVAGHNKWADMGRTGAAGIANFLSPYPEEIYRKQALLHSRLIGKHPQSFPDTHGSPVMGMAYSALAANVEPQNFRSLMDANSWWFTLAQCRDGSIYYQPNRDNAGYGDDSRMTGTAAAAFIFSIPKRSLVLTGKEVKRR